MSNPVAQTGLEKGKERVGDLSQPDPFPYELSESEERLYRDPPEYITTEDKHEQWLINTILERTGAGQSRTAVTGWVHQVSKIAKESKLDTPLKGIVDPSTVLNLISDLEKGEHPLFVEYAAQKVVSNQLFDDCYENLGEDGWFDPCASDEKATDVYVPVLCVMGRYAQWDEAVAKKIFSKINRGSCQQILLNEFGQDQAKVDTYFHEEYNLALDRILKKEETLWQGEPWILRCVASTMWVLYFPDNPPSTKVLREDEEVGQRSRSTSRRRPKEPLFLPSKNRKGELRSLWNQPKKGHALFKASKEQRSYALPIVEHVSEGSEPSSSRSSGERGRHSQVSIEHS